MIDEPSYHAITPDWAVTMIGQLTGRARGRVTRFGNVILQVEVWEWGHSFLGCYGVTVKHPTDSGKMLTTKWRDAKPTDLGCFPVFGDAQVPV